MIKVIIFDLDGTLVDTNKLINNLWSTWCNEHNIDVTNVLTNFHGVRTEEVIKAVAPHMDASKESERLELLASKLIGGVEPIKGAKAFIDKIPVNKWAVCTSGSYDNSLSKLHKCEIEEPLVFITSDVVSNGKPHPEPYLLTSEKLGVPIDKCLVFEDSDNGLESALSAGCKVISINNQTNIIHANLLGNVTDFTELDLTVLKNGLKIDIHCPLKNEYT